MTWMKFIYFLAFGFKEHLQNTYIYLFKGTSCNLNLRSVNYKTCPYSLDQLDIWLLFKKRIMWKKKKHWTWLIDMQKNQLSEESKSEFSQ